MNCHLYCRYSNYCSLEGEEKLDPDDCVRFWKIDDLMQEAIFVERELKEENKEENDND